MANLKELRRRISSIGSTMKITAAMKMVSAAKLKKAQDAIQSLRPFTQKLTDILQKAMPALNPDDTPFARKSEVKRVLLIVVTSNRGLCGPFNSAVIKTATARMNFYKNVEVDIIAIGKKSNDAFKRSGKVIQTEFDIWNELNFRNANVISDAVMARFLAGEWDKVEVIYNQFRNAAVQVPTYEQVLPIEMPDSGKVITTNYIYEPSKDGIAATLIPIKIQAQIFKALVDSNASEHGARMTAMHKATDNAKDLQGRLKLEYNKARQAAITNEILEIVSGANALEG